LKCTIFGVSLFLYFGLRARRKIPRKVRASNRVPRIIEARSREIVMPSACARSGAAAAPTTKAISGRMKTVHPPLRTSLELISMVTSCPGLSPSGASTSRDIFPPRPGIPEPSCEQRRHSPHLSVGVRRISARPAVIEMTLPFSVTAPARRLSSFPVLGAFLFESQRAQGRPSTTGLSTTFAVASRRELRQTIALMFQQRRPMIQANSAVNRRTPILAIASERFNGGLSQ